MPALVDFLGIIITPTTDPALGDLVGRGPSGGWTTFLAAGAAPNSVLTMDPVSSLPTWAGGFVDKLPQASEQHRGRVYVLKGQGGNPDQVYVCLKSGTDNYVWKTLVTG